MKYHYSFNISNTGYMNKEVKLSKKQKIYMPIKRAIDLFGSLFGIIVCFVFLWWWILLVNLFSSRGKPVFRQERVGRNGKVFKLLKFRTMKPDIDPNLTSFEISNVDCYTCFGKFLRKTSLDETLQLLNIFVGQMSFIGPRPLIDYRDDKITNDIRKENGSISLRPGLSGYAQVQGRATVDPEHKAELDLYYFEHFSLLLDIKLFLLSIFKSFN